jgi:glutamate/tyrosine decarboxylase-like PLP-dependent enzyme
MDVSSLEEALQRGDVGTVVVTLGSTALGSIDPLHEIVPLARAAGVRVHVDAAYGGFFTLLAQRVPALVDPAPFAALGQADSVVVDPHKHGLQPYGCGCVIFADPEVGAVYRHESPYTYFTSEQLHLGEITLECSRAGASAAALWTTLRAVPLAPDHGLGESLAAGRRAASAWASLIESEPSLRLLTEPMTDIVCFAPCRPGAAKASEISRATEDVFRAGMIEGADAFFLAKLRVAREQAEALWPDVEWDQPEVVVLRSALIKPEHEAWVATLHQRVVVASNVALGTA